MNELQQRIFSQEAPGLPASQTDRRREPRNRSARPVYVRPADPSESDFEEVRTMINFSRTGFYFITPRIASYRKGMMLYAIPSLGCFNFEYLGEVVRIENLACSEYGIAVHLIRLGSPPLSPSTLVKSAFQSFSGVAEIPPGKVLSEEKR